jgi:SpoVK/Ycf46/Vps4 family AAA+-type ATPase
MTTQSAQKKSNKLADTKRSTPSLVPLDVGRTSRASPFVELVKPERTRDEIILSPDNRSIFAGLLEEFRKGDSLRRHGLRVKSNLLFCGPPGCGKSATAEAFANEIGLDLMIVRLDAVISSYLGETASNLKAVFEAVERSPCVLFFDEFDALARTREDASEHNEIRRVVNSLLMMIERFKGRGFIIAATNLETTLDQALWRRFDEVIYFDRPTLARVKAMLRLKTKTFPAAFDIEERAEELKDYSYAEIETVVSSAIKLAIIGRRKRISEQDFNKSLKDQVRRRRVQKKLTSQ